MSPAARWPPGRGTVIVPLGRRREAAAGLSLDGPSRAVPRLGTAAAWLAVWVAGPVVLRPWVAATDEVAVAGLDGVLEDLRTSVGPFDAVAVHRPRQPERRHRALLLLRKGRSVAFVKVRSEAAPLAAEQAALRAVGGRRLAGVHVPEPFGSGSVDGLRWSAMAPLPPRPHRPVLRADLTDLVAALVEGLAGLPRPEGISGTWAPCHGDLTPWNHRSVLGGGQWLFDWERSRWAPPHADLVLAAAARSALGPPLTAPGDGAEAAAWWLAQPEIVRADDDLAIRIRQALEAVRAVG